MPDIHVLFSELFISNLSKGYADIKYGELDVYFYTSTIGKNICLVAGLDVRRDSPNSRKIKIIPPNPILASKTQWLAMGTEQKAAQLAIALHKIEKSWLDSAVELSVKVAALFENKDNLNSSLPKVESRLIKSPRTIEALHTLVDQSLEKSKQIKKDKDVATRVGEAIKLSEYPLIFPAYRRNRKLIAILGPTNSGKTFDAFSRLSAAQSGIYLAPLRLLALEAYQRLNEEFKVSTSLVTGEEKRITDEAKVLASTIEMLDTNAAYEVAVIDEIQMLADPDRGWAWTQAIVGANADEIWVLGALSAEKAIKALAARLNIPFEIRKKERKNPLKVGEALAGSPEVSLTRTQPGDALIVFSRKDALSLRDDLLSLGKSVSCIYGALSPEVREKEAGRFASGESEILVATDAIGMGLNLPIQRVVMTSVQKYDGASRSPISVSLLQQIAGRAGRYGIQAEPGTVHGICPREHNYVEESMKKPQGIIPSNGFYISAGAEYLEIISRISQVPSLASLLLIFEAHASRGDGFFKPKVPVDQLEKAYSLDRFKNLPLKLKFILSLTPLSLNTEEGEQLWEDWLRIVDGGEDFVGLATIPGAKGNPERASLQEAENVLKHISAYRWLAFRLPELFPDMVPATELIPQWVDCVDAHLASNIQQGKVGSNRFGPSWYYAVRSGGGSA